MYQCWKSRARLDAGDRGVTPAVGVEFVGRLALVVDDVGLLTSGFAD